MGKIGCVVLAGGYGRRFQSFDKWVDKLLYPLNGKPILLRVVEEALKVADELVVVTKGSRVEEYSRVIGREGVKVVSDEEGAYHPLYGLRASLKHLSSDLALVVAGDMPYVSSNSLKLLLKELAEGFDLAVPVWPNGLLEPFLSIFSCKHLRSVEVVIKKPRPKPTDLIRSARRVKLVPTLKFKDVDPELRTFISVNRVGDLRARGVRVAQEGVLIKGYEVEGPSRFYWSAHNALMENRYSEAMELFLKEAELYGELGLAHLELHSYYDVVNCAELLKTRVPSPLVNRIEELEGALSRGVEYVTG